jgi:hypothetical protein
MRNISFIFLLITLAVSSCNSSKPYYDGYGRSEKKVLQNNPAYNGGNLYYVIAPYTFKFDIVEFRDKMSKTDSNSNLPAGSLIINQEKDKIVVNGKLELYPIESFDIDKVLDELFSEGKFFVVGETERIYKIEYFHVIPQSQGNESSEWVIEDKIVRKKTFASID